MPGGQLLSTQKVDTPRAAGGRLPCDEVVFPLERLGRLGTSVVARTSGPSVGGTPGGPGVRRCNEPGPAGIYRA
jgi:hypothetical protein